MNIISRKDAKKKGLKEYFTGNACKHGHVSSRKVSNNNCVACQKEYYKQNKKQYQQHYQNNREIIIENQRIRDSQRADDIHNYQKEYRKRTTEKRLQYHKDYYQTNKDNLKIQSGHHRADNTEYYSEYDKIYYNDNQNELSEYSRRYYCSNRENILEKKKKYYTNNKNDFIARNAKRRCTKLAATPLWYEHKKVKALYEESARLTKETGIQHNVDHIIPLHNKSVCGLHCYDNLRVITGAENMKKGNKFKI